MLIWLWLLILGWITYLILRRSVPRSTKAPLWLLWLVMMTPALLWSAWKLRFPQSQIPWALVLGPLLLLPIVYRLLLQWGPPAPPATPFSPPASSPSTASQPPHQPLAASRPLSAEEEIQLKQCFSWSDYFLQKIEYRLQAVICQGQLRTDPAAAYRTIQARVEEAFGNRFLLLLQEDLVGKPFFALVPNPQAQESPRTEKVRRPFVALALLALTVLTTNQAGIVLSGHRLERIAGDPSLLLHGLPYAIALLLILGTHELGHFWMACRYKLQATLPYFIPMPVLPGTLGTLGTFGAFIQIRSPMPNRRVLFDVGIAGPLAGLAIILPLLTWGLMHSRVVDAPDQLRLLNFEALNPQASLLLAFMSKLCLGEALTAQSALSLHPVAIASYLGLIVTAMNLMPVGQLDGGHVVHAMFGQRVGAIIGQIARFLMFILALVPGRGELLLWALLLLFIPAVDEPALNDVSELDDRRDFLGILSLGILLLIILPLPPALANLIL